MRDLIATSGYDQWENQAANRDAQEASNYYRWMDQQRQNAQLQEQMNQDAFNNQFNTAGRMAEWARQGRLDTRNAQQQQFSNDLLTKQFNLSDLVAKDKIANDNMADVRNMYGVRDLLEQGIVKPEDALAMIKKERQTPAMLEAFKSIAAQGAENKRAQYAQQQAFANTLNQGTDIDRQLAEAKARQAPGSGAYDYSKNGISWFQHLVPWNNAQETQLAAKKAADANLPQTLADLQKPVLMARDAIAQGKGLPVIQDPTTGQYKPVMSNPYLGGIPAPTPAPVSTPSASPGGYMGGMPAPQSTTDPATTARIQAKQMFKAGKLNIGQLPAVNQRLKQLGTVPIDPRELQ